METELQKDVQESEAKEVKEEKSEVVTDTLPKLENISDTVNFKDVEHVILDEENKENTDPMTDNNIKENEVKDVDDVIKEKESEKDEYNDSDKINIKGSVEKQVLELDESDHIQKKSNTTLSLIGNKEKITKDTSLENFSISEEIEVDDKIVKTIHFDETVVDKPLERTVYEAISKVENNPDDTMIKSIETDKITIKNLETNEIISTDRTITKREVTKTPDRTLTATVTLKESNDKISEELTTHSVEVKEIFEDSINGQKNIETTTKRETITETPVEKRTVKIVASDNTTINKNVTSMDSDKQDLQNQSVKKPQTDMSIKKPKIDVIAITEIREVRPQIEDNDDEDLETPTPATPEGEDDLIIASSKVAPELVSVVRDLKEASDEFDPIKRSWDDLKLHKGLENSTETDKVEEEKLVQKALDSIKEVLMEEANDDESASKEADQEADQEEGKVLLDTQMQTLTQPTSPSLMVDDVVKSMITPGFNNNVVLAMNICFWLLFAALIFLAIITDYNYMVLLNMGISILLYISMCWFVAVTRAAQLEEEAKKKN